jgi:hypothetical protein
MFRESHAKILKHYRIRNGFFKFYLREVFRPWARFAAHAA